MNSLLLELEGIYIHVQNVYIKAVVHFESVLKNPWNRQIWFRYEVCCCCYLFRSQAHIFIFFMSKRKTQNPWSLQGQNRQFADRRDDSTQTMIVDKFYHFHPHHVDRGSLVMSAQWANVLYKPTCTKYLGRIKFALKINANVVIFIACGIW